MEERKKVWKFSKFTLHTKTLRNYLLTSKCHIFLIKLEIGPTSKHKR